MGRYLIAVVAVAVVWGQCGTGYTDPLTAAQVCEAAKLTVAGKKERCLVAERVNEVRGKVPNYSKCSTAFTTAFTRAETKAGPGVCPSQGDVGAVETLIDKCFADVTAALAGTPNPTCGAAAFGATGQTTLQVLTLCWP